MKIEDYKIFRTRKYFPYPADWSLETHSSQEAAELCGKSFANIYFLHDHGFVTAIYPNEEQSKIGKTILQKIVGDPAITGRINNEQKKRGESLILSAEKISNHLSLNDKIAIDKLNASAQDLKQQWIEYNNLELFWYLGAEFLKDHILKEVAKANIALSEDDFALLTTPTENTFSATEEIDILESALFIASNKSELKTEVNKLVCKYYWIPFGYDGPTLYDKNHYQKILNDHIAKGRNQIQTKLDELKNRKVILLRRKKEIYHKNLIGPEIVKYIDDLNIMILMADYRKECTTKSQIAYDRILAKYCDLLNVEKDALKHLDIDEIIARYTDPNQINDLYKQRTGLMLNGVENHLRFCDLGIRAKIFKDLIVDKNEGGIIKGFIASKGKNPTIIAKVKLLFTPTDLGKVESGDVVVSPMTTPQYTSALRKAAAVITDEGGITCHAAIISRELNIPCIIGTKNATKVLKDGDMVEVNADNGVVKILNN